MAVATSLALALMAVGDTSDAFHALEQAQPRGAYLWYALPALALVSHWPPSARLEHLIREARVP